MVLNLPGSDTYNPSLPWVCKVRKQDGKVTNDFFIYVDDQRVTGSTRSQAWVACQRVSSIINWLGIQDAPRKRCDSSRTSGAWAGSVVYSTEEDLFALVTEEKWMKE